MWDVRCEIDRFGIVEGRGHGDKARKDTQVMGDG
jgi:hypothetical protein